MTESAARGAGTAMAVSAAGNLRPDQVRAGRRYRRLDASGADDVLAVDSERGRVLIVARWDWSPKWQGFNSRNCLHLGLADFAARYSERRA